MPNHLEKLAAYVPAPVAQKIYDTPDVVNVPSEHRFPAVVLFADISGFTRLSEQLGQIGSAGVEELSFLINRYFSRMIEIIQAHQGQVVKFSGDALTVLFPATPSLETAIRRAGECALSMQNKMSDFANLQTSLNTKASLSLKVGVGAGEILACTVGGALGRWEYLVAGPPLVQVAKAEHAARPRQIIFSPEAWSEAAPFFSSQPVHNHEGFVQLQTALKPLAPSTPYQIDWLALSAENQTFAEKALQGYVPGAAKIRITENADWLAELRRITIVFISVRNVDYEAAAVLPQLQAFIRTVQEVLYQFEGSLNKVAVDDKGTVLLLLFGAPPVSHEDDTTRAVACALELQRVAAQQGLSIAIGISEGQVFSGPVGAENRREYTVIGDEVNLAARLMQHAAKSNLPIVISKRAKELAGPHFIVQALGKIPIKGKSHHLTAYAVQGEQDAQDEFIARHLSNNQALIGREAELEFIRALAQKTQQGQFQLLTIEGELGVGKSRLTTELVKEWVSAGGAVYGGQSLSYNRHTPYQVWRTVVAKILGLTADLTNEQKVHRLREGIEMLPARSGQPKFWLNRMPLVAEMLQVDVAENSFTRDISGELRRNNSFAVIEALLRHQVNHDQHVMILLEDIHWSDELSLSLIEYLAATLADLPILFVLTHRPLTESPWKKLPGIEELPYSQAVRLNALSDEESSQVLTLFLNGHQIPADMMDILLHRAQGNPFFLQQIGKAVVDILPSSSNGSNESGSMTTLPELPDTIQNVILARVDRLSDQTAKFTLKVAAVIGMRFQRNLLLSAHPMAPSLDGLTQQLKHLETENLIQLDTAGPKWVYIFDSFITQEVVYEGLLLAQRRQLHALVGSALERTNPDDVERLTYHYARSDSIDNGINYLTISAQKAEREYANQAAINYYSMILELFSIPDGTTGRPKGIISTQYWDFLMARARLNNLIGERDDEIEDLGTLGVVGEALNDNYRRALGAQQWAYLYGSAGNYQEGIEQIKRSVELAEIIEDDKLAGQGYNYWGQLSYLLHNYEMAYEYLQKSLIIAQGQQDKNAQAECLNSLGMVAHYQTEYDVALYFFAETSSLRKALDNQVGLAETLTQLGRVYYDMGQYMQALHTFTDALDLHLTIGDRTGEAYTRQNLGRVYRSLGDYATAKSFQEQALTLHQAVTDRRGEAFSLYNLGLLHIRLQDYDKAQIYTGEALATLREIDYDPWPLGDALAYHGWLLYEQNKFDEAEAQFVEALQIERALKQEPAVIEIKAHLGRIALAQNNLLLAEAYAQEILVYLKSHDAKGIEHAGLVYLTVHTILHASGQTEPALKTLEQGWQYLQNQLLEINSPELQKTYLHHLPEHQKICQLIKETETPPVSSRPQQS